MTVPDAAAVPDGTAVPDAAAVPDGTAVPDAAAVPDGTAVPDAAAVPGGMTLPDAAAVPGRMPLPSTLGRLELLSVAEHPELLAPAVLAAVLDLDGEVKVAAIDPALSDTAAFCDAYGVDLRVSANCVVVTGKREGAEKWAAAVVLATTRADVNGVIRRRVDVRKISFAPMDEAVSRTGMEYGGITPIGLPHEWPVLIDAAVVSEELVIIGSGIRGSKLLLSGATLAKLASAEVIDDLARPV